jgi:hypothetical protein
MPEPTAEERAVERAYDEFIRLGGLDDSEQPTVFRLVVARAHAAARQAEREAGGCPCLVIAPCSETCTCATPILSGGCLRCARYGSLEQRRAHAEWIAAAIRAHGGG